MKNSNFVLTKLKFQITVRGFSLDDDDDDEWSV